MLINIHYGAPQQANLSLGMNVHREGEEVDVAKSCTKSSFLTKKDGDFTSLPSARTRLPLEASR